MERVLASQGGPVVKLKQIAYSALNEYRPVIIAHFPSYRALDGERTWIGRTDIIRVHAELPQSLRSAEGAILSITHNGYEL